jgi:hypothetical protein
MFANAASRPGGFSGNLNRSLTALPQNVLVAARLCEWLRLARGCTVRHAKSALVVLVLVGVPAGAQTFISPPIDKCFVTDSAIYRLTSMPGPAGTTVRVAADPKSSDVTMRVVENPESADFILVDDDQEPAAPNSCRGHAPVRTIHVTTTAPRADLTVGLSAASGQADYSIFVRSATFSVEEAAALFAVMVTSSRPRALAKR